ncbi:cell division topological specificity factor MinE [Natranaerobius thermophilus]|uniref:Cell division topological specificity factor n=1 Tax=Natranaerobius thermophilus (strain ATCC BAA-1301 / DSM 18059 / JW/NM-WN-LF) TaxID=457570 RepID=B2A6A6_NATTJ|nr:cell division topological specificity factor MinE [Natranaerobius thermophilus]ACB84117.1 cell division topological specificity factor MinE [Natranaerobius thermophilus JW/NM-WN-LF]
MLRKNMSKDIAKDRLRLLLVHDRANMSPELLQEVKQEIIDVINKYMEIDEESSEVNLTRGRNSAQLEANMMVKSIKRQK